jgi:hypothetical protein
VNSTTIHCYTHFEPHNTHIVVEHMRYTMPSPPDAVPTIDTMQTVSAVNPDAPKFDPEGKE